MSPVNAQPPALTVAQYAESAKRTDRFANDPKALQQLRFGYFGEIGGLLASIKKVNRDELHETEKDVAAEELGDALWYLVATANYLKIDPDDLGAACMADLRRQFNEAPITPGKGVTFRQLDGILNTHQNGNELDRMKMLGDLAYAAGVLAQEQSDQLTLQAAPLKAEHFGPLLAGLARACATFNLHIEDVAKDNVRKIVSRWPGDNPTYLPLLDDDVKLPDYERFTRKFKMLFEERGTPAKGHVVQSLYGVFVGDRLTDNSNKPDDYRFHDVFHLAYVAHLGWSPVIRALLKRKRKSDPDKDENEDGARAMIIEEGIATWIFNHAKQRDHYENVKVGKLEYGLLKQIQSMVSGYEVDKCPLWQWERAILDGMSVFRQLQKHRGGTVVVDMIDHTLKFEPPAGPLA